MQVHACHGVARQVDVLREVLLGLLDDDPTLEPRDILVMCPDIETYAPLIEAGFGLGDVVGSTGHPAHRLRVRLADRAPGQTNPLLGVASAAARPRRRPGRRRRRCSTWPAAEPVRRRFGFSDDDLDQLDTLGARVGRPVGLRRRAPRPTSGSRATSRTPGSSGSTGCSTGVALSDDSVGVARHRALPLDDVGSAQVDLVGRLTEYVDRLRDATDRLTGTRPLDHWLGGARRRRRPR